MSRKDVFDALVALLRPYAARFSVKADDDSQLYLEEVPASSKPRMFAAVQVKKSYIALHIFPVYMQPRLLDAISPALKGRMQGKSCFNFRSLEETPLKEIAKLLKASEASLKQAP